MTETLSPVMLIVPGAVVAAALAGLAVWWFHPARRYDRALAKALRRIGPETLRNRVIPDGLDGEIQIDLIALTKHGLLVLEVRHANGTVFGGQSLDQWTALTPRSRVAFDNPLELLNRRLVALRAMFGDEVPVLGRVVLVGDVTLGADLPESVTTPQGLMQEFSSQTPRPAANETMAYAAQWERLRREAIAS